jgi:hypothetical protein
MPSAVVANFKKTRGGQRERLSHWRGDSWPLPGQTHRRRARTIDRLSHPALRNKARCISYMRQEDNIYNNRVYGDKCHKTSEYLLHSGRLITK